MKTSLITILLVIYTGSLFAQSTVLIGSSVKHQTIEGWGGSLAWWANIIGGWPDDKIDSACTWITSTNGLNMNVFRYNIPGGDDPSHHHFRADAYAPRFKDTETNAFNWSADSNQLKILLTLKAKRPDCIFEAVSYSPPYWMTKSGCAAGQVDGSDNLKDNYYTQFADYLTDVVKYYKEHYRVVFRTIAPVNEPFSNWWKTPPDFQTLDAADGRTEGCRFLQQNQEKIISEVYKRLGDKGMLGYCTVSGMDANTINEAVNGVNGYIKSGTIDKISQINIHSYSGTKHNELYQLANTQKKRLWQSETGPLGITKKGFANNLEIVARCIKDMRDMKPIAWIDWQLLDQGPYWGHILYNTSSTKLTKGKNYYARMQMSRFIKQGYTIIETNNAQCLAAISPKNTEIILAVCNNSFSDSLYKYDLSTLSNVGQATVYRTSAHFENVHYSSKSYTASSSQSFSGLVNGTYTAKAWVRSTGGQNTCLFEASNFGSTSQSYNLATNHPTYTQVIVSNIKVTNGNCTISFISDAPAGKWCSFDDVEFNLNTSPSVNLIGNPSFEDDTYGLISPSKWTTTGTPNASYTQTGGRVADENCSLVGKINPNGKTITYSAPALSISTLVIPINSSVTNILAGFESQEENFLLFPNPFKTQITIKQNGNFSYAVYNTQGTEIENGSGINELHVGRELNPGIYLIKIQSNVDTIYKKIIKD